MPKTAEQEILAKFPYTPCVHQSDYHIVTNMRFGLTEQQHEIKTGNIQRLERIGNKTNEIRGTETVH